MSAMLDADEASYARLVERRWASANVTGLVAVPLAAGIMVIDYRLMLLSLIVLSLLLLAVIEAVRAGHAQRVDRNTNPEPVQPERSRGPALKPAEGDPSTSMRRPFRVKRVSVQGTVVVVVRRVR